MPPDSIQPSYDGLPFGCMKTVGKRKQATGLSQIDNLFKLVIELRGNKPFIPKGVYRFKTFEEAQAWSLRMMTRKNRVPPR